MNEGQGKKIEEPNIDESGVVLTPAEIDAQKTERENNPNWFREQK